MKRLVLALGLLLSLTASAWAQTCPTRPLGDSSNACASTAFIQNQIAATPLAGFITCPANQFVNVVGAPSVCAQPSFSNISGQATLAQLPTIGANTVLGSIAGGTPIALTTTQHTTLVNLFTTALSGAVPASGGGTTNFLRADGAFAAPPGGASGGAVTPQVRITLVSGQAVMVSSQAGASSVLVTPYGGCIIPIWNGSSFVNTCFAEVSQLTTDTTKSPAAAAANSNYDIFCWIDSGPTNRCTRGPLWTNDTTRSAGTALLLNQGIWTNNASITNGPAAGLGTYVGTIRSDASSLVNFTFGAYGNPCTGSTLGIFNAYNRVPVTVQFGLTTASWTYNVANTWRAINGSTSCLVLQLRGLNEDPIHMTYFAIGTPGAATNMAAGIGVDSTTAFSGTTAFAGAGETIAKMIPASYSGYPGLGLHNYQPIEFNSTTTASTWSGTAGVAFVQSGFRFEGWQ